MARDLDLLDWAITLASAMTGEPTNSVARSVRPTLDDYYAVYWLSPDSGRVKVGRPIQHDEYGWVA